MNFRIGRHLDMEMVPRMLPNKADQLGGVVEATCAHARGQIATQGNQASNAEFAVAIKQASHRIRRVAAHGEVRGHVEARRHHGFHSLERAVAGATPGAVGDGDVIGAPACELIPDGRQLALSRRRFRREELKGKGDSAGHGPSAQPEARRPCPCAPR